MTPEDKRELAEEFVLIPKNKLYYIFGGAGAVVLVATGLSLVSVFAYLRSEPAEIARRRIGEIRAQAENDLKRLQADDSYVRYGNTLALECERHPGFRLHAGGGRNVTVEAKETSSPYMTWTIQAASKK